MGEHLPYKQRVTGSSPVLSTKVKYKALGCCVFSMWDLSHTKNGLVAQLVRALACHARGRGFEPHPSRHFSKYMPRGFSSFGRAPPCQGGGGGFEPRNPLQTKSAFERRRIFCLYYSFFIIHHSLFISYKRILIASINTAKESTH